MLRLVQGFCVSMIVFFLDVYTKSWAQHTLIAYHSKVINRYFNWTLVFNTGSAFSFLANAGPWHVIFLDVISVLMCGVICVWMIYQSEQKIWLEYYGAALILGGALGNVIDRLRFQYVIDFIDVHYQEYHWPVFNVADCAITLGVGCFLWIAIKRIK